MKFEDIEKAKTLSEIYKLHKKNRVRLEYAKFKYDEAIQIYDNLNRKIKSVESKIKKAIK